MFDMASLLILCIHIVQHSYRETNPSNYARWANAYINEFLHHGGELRPGHVGITYVAASGGAERP